MKDILSREFNSIKKDLISKHVELGMKASGKWVESLEVVVGDHGAKILGEEYTKQLVSGRKGGTFPPVEAIKQWIHDKGIVNKIKGNISVSSLAFLIARKIAKNGTKYHQQGGTDLIDSVVTDERIQKVINTIGIHAAVSLSSKLENEFKQIRV